MFTGLVEGLGTIREAGADGPGTRLRIESALVAQALPLGASVAINGVCLTAIDVAGELFAVEAGPETLRLTNLGELRAHDRVNLERSLRVGDRLGGHIVQGHVDGIGRLDRRERQGDWETLWFSCPGELTRHMVRKGSIAVDGVSLTLVDVEPTGFSVALIPHTLDVTTLGPKPIGGTVNLEVDLFAKYVFKALETMALPGR